MEELSRTSSLVSVDTLQLHFEVATRVLLRSVDATTLTVIATSQDECKQSLRLVQRAIRYALTLRDPEPRAVARLGSAWDRSTTMFNALVLLLEARRQEATRRGRAFVEECSVQLCLEVCVEFLDATAHLLRMEILRRCTLTAGGCYSYSLVCSLPYQSPFTLENILSRMLNHNR
jgi:hypothetical protein